MVISRRTLRKGWLAMTVVAFSGASGGGVGCGAGPSPSATADLIVTNAKVWTVDRAQPTAEAVAVAADRIVAVGDRAVVERLRGEHTRVIDAAGRTVLPGFNDSHIHLVEGGMQLDSIDLKSAANPAEFARRLGDRARETPSGDWVLGGNWDEQAWNPPVPPSKDLIDPLTPDTPVFVGRYDLHMALANSVALRLAGVTASTPDPPGGAVVRDARGEPTGLLKDAAMSLVYRVIPPASRERRTRAIVRALEHMASLGVTSVQDMGPDLADVEIYLGLASKGDLTSRVRVAPLLTTWAARASQGAVPVYDFPFLRSGRVKAFADGSLGSTTAYFFEPYTDDPGTAGLLADDMLPVEAMRTRMIDADRNGQQLCIHAIGDRAISMLLDLYEEVERANGRRDRRFRIEHAQHVAPKDFARFARLGVIAAAQPYHAIDDGRWAERRIGPVRARTTYPFRTFLDGGIRLALGSDWPVAPLDPILGIYAAVTRATLDGLHPDGWVPEQRISVAEAIEGYTLGAAYAEFEETAKGSLAAGKVADLVVLSGDPFSGPAAALRDLRVDVTIVGGRVVFERPGDRQSRSGS